MMTSSWYDDYEEERDYDFRTTTSWYHDDDEVGHEPATSWLDNLHPNILQVADNNNNNEPRSADDWQRIRQAYRQGRASLFSNGLTAEKVRQALHFCDSLADELSSPLSASRLPPDDDDDEPLLDDPWVFLAWRHVIVEQIEHQSVPTDILWDELQATVQRIDRYVETGVLAWQPILVSWVLDIWQQQRHASHASHEHMDAEQALTLVQQLTHDYAPERPVDNIVLTRLLRYMAHAKSDPEQANALVQQYLRQQQQAQGVRNGEREEDEEEPSILDFQAYTAWVHVWSVSSRRDAGLQALQILGQAQRDERIPGRVVYHKVLTTLCQSNNTIQAAEILWKELQDLNMLSVTADTWHPLLQAYLRTQAWRQAARLWRSCAVHAKDNVRPNRTARNTLFKTLERERRQGLVNAPPQQQEQQKEDVLPAHIEDWHRVQRAWQKMVDTLQRHKQDPSHTVLATALTFLDRHCLAAMEEPSPPWIASASDMDVLVNFYKRLPKRGGQSRNQQQQPVVALNRMLRSLRKYHGIGLARLRWEALDFLMEGIAKTSGKAGVLSSTEAALAAESLLEEVLEDCNNDVRHPDFVNKVPFLRLIKMWSETPESPGAVEAVWERLWDLYIQSGGSKRLNPDENFYKALLRAWNTSTSCTPQETAQRALELWQNRLEHVVKTPSIEFRHTVTKALAEGGNVEATESMVNEAIEAFRSGETHVRHDLDFVSLLILAQCRAGLHFEALQTLNDLERRSQTNNDPLVQPNSLCYNTMLTELANEQKVGDALALLNLMAEMASAAPQRKIEPSASSWMSIFEALAKSNSTEAAEQAIELLDMFDSLQERFRTTVAPDTFVYNRILQCFVRNPDPQNYISTAESFLQMMESRHGSVEPDSETYELLLHLLLKAQLPGKATRHLERFGRLSQSGKVSARPNRAHFHAVIMGFLQQGDLKSVNSAIGLVELMHSLAMKTVWLVDPDQETYRMVLQHCRSCQVDPHIAEKVLAMMDRNASHGGNAVKPDIEMYVDVIACWASQDDPKAWERIVQLSEHVPQNRIAQDTELYRVVFDACIQCGLMDKAHSLSANVGNSGTPSCRT